MPDRISFSEAEAAIEYALSFCGGMPSVRDKAKQTVGLWLLQTRRDLEELRDCRVALVKIREIIATDADDEEAITAQIAEMDRIADLAIRGLPIGKDEA